MELNRPNLNQIELVCKIYSGGTSVSLTTILVDIEPCNKLIPEINV